MALDLSLAVFVLAMALLGWMRGLWSQLAGIVAFAAMWIGFDLWYPPIDALVAGIGGVFAEYPQVRKLVGFVIGWFAAVLVLAVIEWGVIRRIDGLESGNRAFGLALGGAKGVVYAAALLWLVQGVEAWGRGPGAAPAPWLRESRAVELLGPYNPVYVYVLKERVLEAVARAERARRTLSGATAEGPAAGGGGSGPEATKGPSTERSTTGKDGTKGTVPTEQRQGTQAGGAATSALPEEDKRVWALVRASPLGALVGETATLSEWEGRGYGDLVSDPKVRQALGDASIADILFGDENESTP